MLARGNSLFLLIPGIYLFVAWSVAVPALLGEQLGITARLVHLPQLPAMCAKLNQNMSHKEWREWVSPDIDYMKVCPDLPVAPG